MKYFRLKAEEIDTLPYYEFPNQYNESRPGRSYSRDNLETLVSRKAAYLAGLDESIDPVEKENQFLREGWKFFSEDLTPKGPDTPSSVWVVDCCRMGEWQSHWA
ncbi:hypothetical protein GYMLUDRAFT_75467 [Collybiopsis luxurians FD-317 M1]|uniref:Uncharacterized protein n=1 Tax=Collybiopsis luxurians FD-317 M1 TaxID=944289 RepID=A0A0D0BQT0_9AGAR|nr:hypothetical protein GYMLUDRAFT_75467 [Collybiopsis luxurians FD-317 M1]